MGNHDSSDATRLDNIEAQVAHQDTIVADLNEIVTRQWRKIDALQREIAALRDEFQNARALREGPEPPPPHY